MLFVVWLVNAACLMSLLFRVETGLWPRGMMRAWRAERNRR